MVTFKAQEYPPDMDNELVELCDAVNCLPGIVTSCSCSGHNDKPTEIYFRVHDPQGIFFLARCVSRRYWKYGDVWHIIVSDVCDGLSAGGFAEACYILESEHTGEKAYEEAHSLVQNIVHHLNHKNFLKGHNVDLNSFNVEGEPLGEDWWEQISPVASIPTR